MAGEIIRKDDPTSHGGIVLEGSAVDICHGKPIAYLGHKVSCPKCKGTFPIVEGVMSTTFYGKGVAVAGMKTACGAILVATQFTDTVEWASAGSGTGVQADAAGPQQVAAKPVAPDAIETEHFYTLADAHGNAPEGYLYDLYCDETLQTKAGSYAGGATVKIAGSTASRLVIWLAQDAAARP